MAQRPFVSVYDLIPTEAAFDHVQQALREAGKLDHRLLRLSWAQFQQVRPVIETAEAMREAKRAPKQ